MATIISAIKTQLLADIETTSINKAYEGAVGTTVSTYPWAEVDFGGGRITHNITEQVDREYSMVVRIHGTSTEQVEDAMEDLVVLYNSASSIATLRALGVQVIYQTGHYPPLTYAGGTPQMPIIGDMAFVFRVRYS
jgi:hypothetical protein